MYILLPIVQYKAQWSWVFTAPPSPLNIVKAWLLTLLPLPPPLPPPIPLGLMSIIPIKTTECTLSTTTTTSHERFDLSTHRTLDCLFNSLFRLAQRKCQSFVYKELALLWGASIGDRRFPISLRHYAVLTQFTMSTGCLDHFAQTVMIIDANRVTSYVTIIEKYPKYTWILAPLLQGSNRLQGTVYIIYFRNRRQANVWTI